jgi:hypothetical protein
VAALDMIEADRDLSLVQLAEVIGGLRIMDLPLTKREESVAGS